MVKFAGGVLVFSAAVFVQWQQSARRSHRLQLLAALAAALEQMAVEIRLVQTPLPALVRRMGRTGKASEFFRPVSQGLARGESPAAAWIAAAESLPLDEDGRQALTEAGEGLHGDEESVCAALRRSGARLETCRAEAAVRRQDENRRSGALCFSAAALAVILLM